MTIGVAPPPRTGARELLTAAAGYSYRTARSRFRRMPAYRLLAAGPSPTRVIAVPPPAAPGDPSVAAALYGGRFNLPAGRMDIGAANPFAVEPPSQAWLEQLVGFSWLNHLAAEGGAVASAHARARVADWIGLQGRWHDIAWRPDLTARRLASWLVHADMIVRGGDQAFFDLFMTSIGRQLRYLVSAVDMVDNPQTRLEIRTVIAQAALCLDDCERLLSRASELLCRELEEQILPDGGHVDRNPATLVDLLPGLIDLRETFAQRDLEVPQEVICAIDRMLPMLRMFVHGDGGLASFNGAHDSSETAIARIVSDAASRGRPLTQARYSRYQRVTHQATTLIVDAGGPPPAGYAGSAHAGCLSFELSHGRYRIIVNCGAAPPGDRDWAMVARTTAAHSTATVNDCPSGRIRAGRLTSRLFAGSVIDGPFVVTAEREEGRAGTIIEAAHDGYRRRFGIIHSRRFYLAEDGNDLRGEDAFVRSGRRSLLRGSTAESFAVRFHLHPSVRATASKDGDSVLLLLPNHVGWRFTAAGGTISLEDSVYLAGGEQPRRTRQIVVHGAVKDMAVVKWALKKATRPHAPQAGRQDAAPGLPLGDDGRL